MVDYTLTQLSEKSFVRTTARFFPHTHKTSSCFNSRAEDAQIGMTGEREEKQVNGVCRRRRSGRRQAVRVTEGLRNRLR
jgi:hypothetical protein